MKCTKAIIPVAGYGTRRLPITKAIEKCMLPIGNVPVIDYIVQDCIRAGITDFYFVVSGEAHQLRSYFSRDIQLEEYLKQKGKNDMLSLITPPENVNFHYVTQDTSDGRYGTTVPVWLCRDYVDADEHVLVIMGDQFFYRADGGSNAADLMGLVAGQDAQVGLLGVPVPSDEVEKYGIIERDQSNNYVRIVEHPKPDEAPGNLNNASIYLFDSNMFHYFERDMRTPHTGEYMIIDPINQYVADGNIVKVGEAAGEYLDAGTLDGWLEANQYIATQA